MYYSYIYLEACSKSINLLIEIVAFLLLLSHLVTMEDKVDKLEGDLAALRDLLNKMRVRSDETEKELAATQLKLRAAEGSKTVYISKDRKLDKFSGRKTKDGSLSVDEWIDDASYHLRNLPGAEAQVEFLLDHLQGQARDEIRVLPQSERKSPDRIFGRLRVIFQDEDTVAQIQQAFYQRSQKKDESLQQYSLQLLKIMDRLCKKQKEVVGNRELMLKERFIDGVLDPQLKREMRRFAMDHPEISFQEFRTVVMKWCEDEKRVYTLPQEVEVNAVTKEPEIDVVSILKSQQDLLAKQQQQLDLLTSMMERSASGVQQQALPHRGRGGRRPYGRRFSGSGSSRACHKCGSLEHFIRNCPENKASVPSAEKEVGTLNK